MEGRHVEVADAKPALSIVSDEKDKSRLDILHNWLIQTVGARSMDWEYFSLQKLVSFFWLESLH